MEILYAKTKGDTNLADVLSISFKEPELPIPRKNFGPVLRQVAELSSSQEI